MCSTTKNECSHIAVSDPVVATIISNLEAVAHTACADHAHLILEAVCFLKYHHTLKEQNKKLKPKAKRLPKSITQLLKV